VPAKANRCPHCWSALAEYVNDFCPFCRGSVAPKQKRRRGGDAPEAAPPAPSQPYEPYQRYEPAQPSQPAQRYEPYQPYEPAQPSQPAQRYEPYQSHEPAQPSQPAQRYEPYQSYEPAQPSQPAQRYEPYQSYEPARPAQPAPSNGAYEPLGYSASPPAQPAPAPGQLAAQVGPTGGGVAVAERDPVEFPGTPLPPGFFDALPEKARNPKGRGIPVRAIGVVGLIVVGAAGGISRAADRNDDIASPARHLVKTACAEYRNLSTRLDTDENDLDAFRQLVSWFQTNGDRFAEAAVLDPDLAGASEAVAWFDQAIDAEFEPIKARTQEQLDALEEPLVQACYSGPGRA
jgi:hypothetical protein